VSNCLHIDILIQLDEDEKKVFNEKSEVRKAEYKELKAEYDEQHPE
jgi:hypothetical protein